MSLAEFHPPPRFQRAPSQPLRFWTAREVKILMEHYPKGGAPACMPLLGKTERSIYTKAHALGLRKPGYIKDLSYRRYTPSDTIDDVIRRAYLQPTKGFTKRLAKTVNRPAWWVTMRAQRLGLVSPRFKEPLWSEAEDEIIAGNAHRAPATIQQRLKRHGFARTETAILLRLKRLGQPTGRNASTDHYTANGLAALFGVDAKTVTRWIVNGLLKAGRRGTERVAQQGGDEWWISSRDVRRFIVENVAAVDIRKADKFWLVELLTGTPS